MLALCIGGAAAIAAALFGAARQVGVKSYAYPVGRVARAGEQLAVLMERREPYLPSLRGRSESDMSYSHDLWLIPASGDGSIRKIRVARGVRSSDRSQFAGIVGIDGGDVWLRIQDLHGYDLNSGRPISKLPPHSIANMPISQFLGPINAPALGPYRAHTAMLSEGKWLTLADEQEASTRIGRSERLFHNQTAEGTYRCRSLYAVSAESGPIPRVMDAHRMPLEELHNAAFLRTTEDGEIARFSGPDGFLIVYEAGDPAARTTHFARLNIDGSISWATDSTLGRLKQILPHPSTPAFIGELPGKPSETVLSILHLSDGSIKTLVLKGEPE